MTTLYIQVGVLDSPSPTADYQIVAFTTPNLAQPVEQAGFAQIVSGTTNLSASPFPIFPDTASAIAYYSTTLSPCIPDQILATVNAAIGSTYFTAVDVETVSSAEIAALTGYVPTATTVNGHALTGSIALTASDVGAPSGSGTVSGTNTGDQNLSGLVPKTTTVNGHALSANVTIALGDIVTPGSHIASVATNAADNNATNYNLVSGLLGIANGLNTANGNQNAMADNLNDLATKFNTLISELQTQGILV